MLRHSKLTQISEVLSGLQLRRFSGHSKYSNVTARYIHTDDRAIKKKVYKERGLKLEELEQKETPLTLKVCKRCKTKNSPAFTFCSTCGMPLDLKTMFDVQRKGKLLNEGTLYPVFFGDEKHSDAMKQFSKLEQKNPELVEKLFTQFWQIVAVELLKQQQTVKISKS